MKNRSFLMAGMVAFALSFSHVHTHSPEQEKNIENPDTKTPGFDENTTDVQVPLEKLENSENIQENSEKPDYTPYFFKAIAQGNDAAVRHFIKEKVDINKPYGVKNDTPLIYAIRALHLLVNNLTNIIFTDFQTYAKAYETRLDIIRLILFQPDVNINALNSLGQTALRLASQEGLRDVQELIFTKLHINNVQPSTDIEKYKQQLAKFAIPEDLRKKISQAIDKAVNSLTSAHETGLVNNYLKLVFSLPWDKRTEDINNLGSIREVLDKDHYGLTKVKEEITDYIAVRILQNMKHQKGNAPVLCLVGPPGVGKTSIAKAIAQALGKAFVKISLGGVYEEHSIRGFAKTYVGSEPGKIIKSLINQPKNPVMLLDEIDKMGSSHQHGNPASALLELLDPIQNKEFIDHHLDVPFDVSEVFFIATANSKYDIPYALLDRLKIININSYIQEEKLEIAKRHVIPKLLQELALEDCGLTFNDGLISFIIENYTYESGVRQLEQRLKTLCTKAANIYLQTNKTPEFTLENVVEFLGAEYTADSAKNFIKEPSVGISQGLGVSYGGGSVLIIETALIPGKGEIVITGMLQQVMQESVSIARGYIK